MSSLGRSKPTFWAATSRQPSVGSPITRQPLSSAGGSTLESLAKLMARSSTSRRRRASSLGNVVSPTTKSPTGSYPAPVTSTTVSPVNISLTVISALVRVPVLSVQITLVEPSVSTPISFLIRAFSLAMRCTPMARATDNVAGRPSGTRATITPKANSRAATAPNLKISRAAKNRATPHTTAMIDTVRAIVSISRCNGDFSSETPLVSVKMWPNWVFRPVAKMTA